MKIRLHGVNTAALSGSLLFTVVRAPMVRGNSRSPFIKSLASASKAAETPLTVRVMSHCNYHI